MLWKINFQTDLFIYRFLCYGDAIPQRFFKELPSAAHRKGCAAQARGGQMPLRRISVGLPFFLQKSLTIKKDYV